MFEVKYSFKFHLKEKKISPSSNILHFFLKIFDVASSQSFNLQALSKNYATL